MPRDIFTTIHTEGAILPADLLQRIVNGGPDLDGLLPTNYHLDPNDRLNEAISRSWNRLLGAWETFASLRDNLPPGDPGTSLTRERWLLPLFEELRYGRLQTNRAIELEGKSYPISHGWNGVPLHLVGCGVELDKKTAGVAGAARMSPHGMLQEALNRSDEMLWGFVSNGLRLRVLRDSASLTRQAFVEFDLEGMLRGEVYADFSLLWLLCHESRVERPDGRAAGCWLERWSNEARLTGTRALDKLRQGVEQSISLLGAGFLAQPENRQLRERLRSGELDKQDYFRQLLRTVYRLLFLFVAEDRDLLLTREQTTGGRMPSATTEGTTQPSAARAHAMRPGGLEARQRYEQYYSTARLRHLAERRRGDKHVDLWRGLRLVFGLLGQDDGCPLLGLPALGSFLWSAAASPDLDGCELANEALLDAVRALAFTEAERVRRVVDFRNLGTEELGSVYESLLELHPELHVDAYQFELKAAGGNERKTTGSYYTPTSLIGCLLDSALDPVLAEAARQPDAEQAILSLKVCDPACGSGHFLIAAAHRIARRLAMTRTGDEEPAPEAVRAALRDVIGRCLYGVDINPMAVELCKVSLWLEAIDPGKPLSFLEHHIRAGNSLLGATPRLLSEGIPDAAFNPIEGDDKKVASEWKKRNKLERRPGQLGLNLADAQPWQNLGQIAVAMTRLSREDDTTLAGIRRKEAEWERLVHGSAYEYGQLLADAWCASFVWKKTRDFAYPIHQRIFAEIRRNPWQLASWMKGEIRRLAGQYRFFHWHLAFPDVFRVPGPDETPEQPSDGWPGWLGGFDVVLGNPPWEQTQLEEKQFFAERAPEIANAGTGAIRKRMIAALERSDPVLYATYQSALREADGVSHLVRDSGRFPLCGRGRINTYSIFAETNRLVVGGQGRVGCIVPSGIATDDTTKLFFQDLMKTGALVSLYDFENRDAIFPGVHRSYKFCLLTLAGADQPPAGGADFAFFLHQAGELADPERRFSLSAADLRLLNPNTGTCPIFRSTRDAEITKAIYRRVPVLIKEGPPEENPWGIEFRQGLFNMTSASHLFKTRDQLESAGWRLEGNVFVRGSGSGSGRMPSAPTNDGGRYLPLYEAKMLHQYDHRWATYDDGRMPSAPTNGEPRRGALHAPASDPTTRDLTAAEKDDPTMVPLPRYWVPESEVQARLAGKWDRGWLLGWRDICRSTDERTVIASVLPRVGVGHTYPLLIVSESVQSSVSMLYADVCSFAFDYVARQKVGGTHLTYGYLNQLPVLPPDRYRAVCAWDAERQLGEWLTPRVLELTYTAWDLQPFAKDLGYDGPPFRWGGEPGRAHAMRPYEGDRRFVLRCEIDAAFFHLYGIARDDVEYIMETFPIVKRKDIAAHGEYRTKRVILEMYDAMAEAIRSGDAYQTRLDPAPGDPRAAHRA